MIGIILNAFCKELQSIFETSDSIEMQQVTVLRDTQFKPNEMSVHTMPVVVLSLTDSPDMQQLPGGCTQAEWGWLIKVYFFDPGQDLGPDSGTSVGAYEIIDLIRKHFALQDWISTEFKNVVTNYSYKLTLNGTSIAEPIEANGGICPGFTINYDSIAIDGSTSFTNYSTETLQKTYQNSIITETLSVDETAIEMPKLTDSASFNITSNTSWAIEANVNWLTISEITGQNDEEITIISTSNPLSTNRTGTITITAPITTITPKTIIVTQLGT